MARIELIHNTHSDWQAWGIIKNVETVSPVAAVRQRIVNRRDPKGFFRGLYQP